jgi:hypothetical protein
MSNNHRTFGIDDIGIDENEMWLGTPRVKIPGRHEFNLKELETKQWQNSSPKPEADGCVVFPRPSSEHTQCSKKRAIATGQLLDCTASGWAKFVKKWKLQKP